MNKNIVYLLYVTWPDRNGSWERLTGAYKTEDGVQAKVNDLNLKFPSLAPFQFRVEEMVVE